MTVYGTTENYLRSYGGPVEVENQSEQKLGDSGEISISFGRDIVYPRELISKYDPSYQESVPKLELSDGDKQDIQSKYEELLQAYDDRQAAAKAATDLESA